MSRSRPWSLLLSGVVWVAGLGALAPAQVTHRVSVDSNGAEANLDSYSNSQYAMNASGRFVVFSSKANNLVPADNNGRQDVFVRDRLLGTTTRVSVDSNGTEGDKDSFSPTISADGRLVAFTSHATNLVPNDLNGAVDCFVHDRWLGTTVRVSVRSDGTEVAQGGSSSTISGDGLLVVFDSSSSQLVQNDTNNQWDVFAHELGSGVTTRLSVDSSGNEADHQSFVHSVSHDGRFVNFQSLASNLVPQDQNGAWDVFLRDRTLSTTVRASLDEQGQEVPDSCYSGAISDDGRYVGFNTWYPAVSGDQDTQLDSYVRDLVGGTTTQVSVNSNGHGADLAASSNDMSSDGRFVTLYSLATNLVPNDNNGTWDAFVHDLLTKTTTRVSVDSNGTEGNDVTSPACVSDDGRFFVYRSDASNLVSRDRNDVSDVFTHGRPLTLDVDPPALPPSTDVTISSWRGKPGAPLLLAAVGLNGSPLFWKLVVAPFDSAGTFTFSTTVPPGLSGNVVTLQGFGFIKSGAVDSSNPLDVPLQ